MFNWNWSRSEDFEFFIWFRIDILVPVNLTVEHDVRRIYPTLAKVEKYLDFYKKLSIFGKYSPLANPALQVKKMS